MNQNEYHRQVCRIAGEDGRYEPAAFAFVQHAVQYAATEISRSTREDHIRGQDLLLGIRDLAVRQFGPMTKPLLSEWGIYESIDFGHIVFLLVQHKLLRASKQDSLDDFADGLDFHEAFVKDFEPEGKVVELPTIA